MGLMYNKSSWDKIQELTKLCLSNTKLVSRFLGIRISRKQVVTIV